MAKKNKAKVVKSKPVKKTPQKVARKISPAKKSKPVSKAKPVTKKAVKKIPQKIIKKVSSPKKKIPEKKKPVIVKQKKFVAKIIDKKAAVAKNKKSSVSTKANLNQAPAKKIFKEEIKETKKVNIEEKNNNLPKNDFLGVKDELKISLNSQAQSPLLKKPSLILIPSFPQAKEDFEGKRKKEVEKTKNSNQIAFSKSKEINNKGRKMNTAIKKVNVKLDKSGKAILPDGYLPSEDEKYMNPLQVEYFKRKLESWKKDLLAESNDTIEHLQVESWNEPDPSDQATIVEQTGLELRTRDRYRKLINKIDSAIRRIDEGEYGYCEVTGDPIGLKRLEARPIATMSIAAQEQHELEEKMAFED